MIKVNEGDNNEIQTCPRISIFTWWESKVFLANQKVAVAAMNFSPSSTSNNSGLVYRSDSMRRTGRPQSAPRTRTKPNYTAYISASGTKRTSAPETSFSSSGDEADGGMSHRVGEQWTRPKSILDERKRVHFEDVSFGSFQDNKQRDKMRGNTDSIIIQANNLQAKASRKK